MKEIVMSKKEISQISIFEKLKEKGITQQAASVKLGLTDRQVRNKLKIYLKEGASSLAHKGRGRPSNSRWDVEERNFALDLLKNDFEGFGPTFAAQKLFEIYGIQISGETLRKEMIKAHLRTKKKQKSKHPQRRERKRFFGQMIQLDGSDHDWFEGRTERCTLLVFIDDATSRIVWLEFAKNESYASLMLATKNYISNFGRPVSFYTDHGRVFHVNLNNADHDKFTQFERAIQELDIEMIHAHSPQAKGRVERVNKTLQDRLVKELRLAGISSMAEANEFVKHYIQSHNKMFAVKPLQTEDVHRSCHGFDLYSIFSIKEERVLQNDFIVCYQKRFFQLQGQQKTILRPKDRITITTHLDGSISLSIRTTTLYFNEVTMRQTKSSLHQPQKTVKFYKPAKTHPWRTGFKLSFSR